MTVSVTAIDCPTCLKHDLAVPNKDCRLCQGTEVLLTVPDSDEGQARLRISPALKEEIIIHIVNGLTTDGAHHKQWDLEQLLDTVDPEGLTRKAREEDEVYGMRDKGIAP